MSNAKNIASVAVGGIEFAQGDGILLAASCTRTRDKKGGSLSLTLADPRGVLANSLPLPASNAPVQVVAVWGPLGRQRRIFTGTLTTFRWNMGSKRVELVAVDKCRAAKVVERARVRSASDLQDLAREVADSIGATLDAPSALIRRLGAYGTVVQHGESDWELLARLCGAVGVDVWLEESGELLGSSPLETPPTLYLRPAGELGKDTKAVVLRAGDNLVSWEVEVEKKTRRTTSNIVNLKGVPVLEGGDAEAQARAVHLANTGVVLGASEDAPSFTEADIQGALLAGARQRKVFTAKATISPAEPGLGPARAVFAEGVGARYNGAWVIQSITDELLMDRQQLDLYNDGAP